MYARDIISQVGETITVQIKTKTLDERGYGTETLVTSGTTTAVVQVMTLTDDEVREGQMQNGDLQIFFEPDNEFADYFDTDTYEIYILWNGKTFKVYNIIREYGIESGHYELHAKRY